MKQMKEGIMKRTTAAISAVFGIVLLLSGPLGVGAQESEEDTFTLEEITVTAQKRSENQQKVAVAMDTVSGEEMRELGYTNLEEIMSSISTAFINKAGDGMRVSIRGMSDDIRAAGSLGDFSVSTPTVAVNVDGVYTSRRNSGSGLYDMERVEVLFGPQSTMYSTSSPGGIVNIVTADPKLDNYEASGSLTYGNYETLQSEGMVNVPVTDTMAIRAAFSTSVRDGYLANGSDDEDSKSARLKALYQAGDTLSVVVTGEYTTRGGNGYSGINMFVDQDDLEDPWDNSYADTPPPRSQDDKKVSGHLDWNIGFGVVTLISSYVEESSSATFTRQDPFAGVSLSHSMDRSGTEKGTEIRLSSPSDSPIKWLLGANTYRSDAVQMDLPETGNYEERTITEDTDAIYGNITYPFSDRLRVTAGLRKTTDENYLLERLFGGTVVMPVTTKYDDWDHKIGFEYDLGENSMLYADWSTSYRSVGMPLRELNPERLDAYTLGSKNRFLDNRLQVNMSAYFYDYTDYVADFGWVSDPTQGGRSDDGSLTNADLEKIGVDLQTTTIISNNDKLDVSISYLSSEFTNLVFDFINPGFPDQEYTGKPETFSPEWTINVIYKHIFNLPNGGSLTARIDSRYQTSYLVNYVDVYQEIIFGGGGPPMGTYNFFSRADFIEQEAHHISNISAVYADPDGKWTLTGYVRNLEDYAEKKNFMMNSMMIGPPRTYGAVLSVRF
jgi:iron complex outermembrane receptor protein